MLYSDFAPSKDLRAFAQKPIVPRNISRKGAK
jgi:hypothetical protein